VEFSDRRACECTFGAAFNRSATEKGCVIKPTRRSVIARHLNNSFVGGRTEDTLQRAVRIRAFPRNAVMDRKMFKAA